MKRVLIITHFFPPSQCPASVRLGKMAKYLPEFGWELRVLTVPPEIHPHPTTLPVEVPESWVVSARYCDPLTSLERQVYVASGRTGRAAVRSAKRGTPTSYLRPLLRALWRLFPLNYTRFPDRAVLWYVPGIRAGLELIREWHPSVLFSSSGPVASHVIGSVLRRWTDIPWVADYRDLWTNNHGVVYPRWVDKLECVLEKWVLKPADVLTTVSEALAAYLRILHNKQVEVVTNGFDEDDFDQPVTLLKPFTITYTGQVDLTVLNPSSLFAAMTQLQADKFITPETFSVRFFGPSPGPTLLALAEQHGVAPYVRVEGSIPYAESVRRQKESTVLLMLNWSGRPVEGILSSKLLEYLGAGRPILAVGPRDPGVSAILAETQAGWWSDNPAEIAGQLREWITWYDRLGDLPLQMDKRKVARFGRRAQTHVLADILARVAE